MAFHEELKKSVGKTDCILLGCCGRFHDKSDIWAGFFKDLEKKSDPVAQRPYLETIALLKWRVKIREWWEIRLKKYTGIKLWKFVIFNHKMLQSERNWKLYILKDISTCNNAHDQGSQDHAPEYLQFVVYLSQF